MSEPLLRLSDLAIGYGAGRRTRVVSSGLSATLPPAGVTALVGVNGTGKSTLLRTLAGLQRPLSGSVSWQGQSLSGSSAAQLARTVSVVLTAHPSANGLTAFEIAAMGRMPHTGPAGRLTPADRAIVDEALHLTGAAHLSRCEFARLSDGERQRVMIAKALAQQTPAILLDEPTAFLDFPAKVQTLRLLSALAQRQGKAILYSTHDLELAFRLTPRLWVLTPGGLAADTPQALAADGTIGRTFGGAGLHFCADKLRFSTSSPAPGPPGNFLSSLLTHTPTT